MTSNRQTTESTSGGQEESSLVRAGQAAKEEAVAASDLQAAPDSQTGVQGDSFYNPALTGSGTIMADGTYGAPLPDPNLKRREDDPEITTDLKVPEGANTSDGSDQPTRPAAKKATAKAPASNS